MLKRVNTDLIQFFVDLANAEPVEDVTPLSQQYGVEDPYTEYGGGATSTWVENPHHIALQIHLVIIEANVHGEDGFDNNGCSDNECEDVSDPDVDHVPDNFCNKKADDENDYTSSIENPSRDITIRNDPKVHMSIIDPCVAHAFEFLKYLNIISAHLMLADPESKELFMGQRFARKDKCVAAIKRHSMKV
ncbi:hypothetical protein PVK06_028679 [Gossypium arboreum]|uniref:Uncharacterized protein n=1 Tax=Gossypium arboreum TaxID=29729 RepID=A0ABR0P3N2_GOSAR|nr:hypothetical protein PVK06_028679 [Gossypium arboreum]